jgi:hypothetical protein
MNWKDYLNSSKSSANLIIKTSLFVFIYFSLAIAQTSQVNDNTKVEDSVYIPTKSAWTAVLLSALAPGAGQIYNESYLKAPVVWGLMGWLAYNWIQNNKDYKNYKDLFAQTQDEDFRRLRTFYRDQRDMFSIYIGLSYLLNLVDAYVDAQLFDFTVEEDFLIGQPRLNLRINLP